MTINSGATGRGLIAALGCAGLVGLSHPAGAQQISQDKSAELLRDAVRRINSTAADASSASIVGTVRDAAGAIVTGADVTITHVATATAIGRTSDAEGVFSVEDLAPGLYQITATQPGFRKADGSVVLMAAQRMRTSVKLAAASANDSAVTAASGATPDPAALESRIEQLEAELATLKANAKSLSTLFSPQGQAAAPAAPATPAVDNDTPFAFGDFTWVNGGPRNKKVAFDSPFFTPEVRFDTHYMYSFANPIDHTLGGATESFRTGEVQVEQASVGGDFHMDNVRGRILFMQGLFATTTPRNDASSAVGQWDVRGAYKYVSEAYGGYHFNVQHGLNVDAGIFVSYIGLFSYYNFDNWTYQPSYVSSNTPWFFNGLRIQWFPTNKLKIEPWFINGWQSYNKFNNRPGMGGQILYTPTENIKIVMNNYFNGTDTLGVPDRKRFQTDDSFLLRYYNKPENDGISQMAMSFTADWGCEYGGGVTCTGSGTTSEGPIQQFKGWMAYDHIWFHRNQFAITPGGGIMSNPGRYLTLLPPINGADAVSGSPYFPATPGSQAQQWDMTLNLQWYPKEFITFWWEGGYRHSDIPYFSGRGGITPPGGNNGSPQYYACSTGASSGASDIVAAQAACGGGSSSVWFPDLRKEQTTLSMGIMVKF